MPFMSLKTEPSQENSDNYKVVLKPILGVEPGIYLTALYSIVLVAILFMVLILPGLLNRRSLVHFDSEPKGAAIKMDGAFIGSTPFGFSVSAGMHEFEYGLPGFQVERRKSDFGGSIFASLIIPTKSTDRIELTCNEPVRTLADGASEFVAWTFSGEPTLAYQVPLPLSESAYRIAPALREDPIIQLKSLMILQEAARYAATEASLRDLARAIFLLRGTGLSSSPSVALGAMSDILNYASANMGTSRWLVATLPHSISKTILASSWYANAQQSEAYETDIGTQGTTTSGLKPVTIRNVTFNPVPEGRLVTGEEVKRSIHLEAFLIAETEITLTVWNEFLRAKPEWDPSNIADLLEKGYVSEIYLQKYSAPAYPEDSVSGVSWFAAKAFCDWLQEQLPAGMGGFKVDLPTEIQWQYAAESGSVKASGFDGSLWEWCAEYFAPYVFLPSISDSPVTGPERSIRGGSWVNTPGTVKTSTRAALPPRNCSPFVGFRPVIVLRNN